MDFALKMLHYHFEALQDPNNKRLLTQVLTEDMKLEKSVLEDFWMDSEKASRNAEWTRRGRMMGAPPVPKFIITCGTSNENLCDRTPHDGPTNPSYFLKLFEMCQSDVKSQKEEL